LLVGDSLEKEVSGAIMKSKVMVGVPRVPPKGGQMSISPTFYEQLLRQNPFAKKIQTQIISTY
jgi:hypothetical protein